MGGSASRAKGASGEIEVRNILRDFGFDAAERSPHSGALAWLPGDIANGPVGYHLEVKRCETLSVKKWLEQAESECGTNIPLVVFRQSRQPWRVIIPLEDLLRIITGQPIQRPENGDVQTVYDYWRKVMGKKRSVLTPERKRAIQKALKDLTVDECRQAILGCCASDWHMGANDQGTVFNDLTLIFRSAEKWERFIELSEKSKTSDAEAELESICL